MPIVQAKDMCWHATPSTTFSVCTQAKGASMTFKALLVRSESGRLPKHFPLTWLHSDLAARGINESSLACGEPTVRVLVVRDPFERLLSGYNMMAKEALAGKIFSSMSSAKPLLGLGNNRSIGPDSFARFLEQTSDYTNSTPRWPERILEHLLPFTSLYWRLKSNCALQPKERFGMVLRLEEQPRWYSTFLRRLNLTAAASDPRWSTARSAAKGCWWSPPGVPCSEVLARSDATASGLSPTRSLSAFEYSPMDCALSASHESESHGFTSAYRQRSQAERGSSCERLGVFYARAEVRDNALRFLRGDLGFWAFQQPSFGYGAAAV